MDEVKTPEKLWSAALIYLIFIGTLNAISFGMVGPLIPGFAVSLGASLSFAGVAAGIFSFSALIGRPFASVIGDRFNKKYVLIMFLFLNGLITALYAFVPSIGWFLPARVLHGLFFAVTGTVNFALGAEFVPKSRMAEGIGFIGLTMVVGMAIGPNIGIIVLENFSYQSSFAVSGAGIMLASLFLTRLKYKSKSEIRVGGAGIGSLRFKDLIAVELLPNAGFVAMMSIGSGLASSYLVILGSERNIGNVGLYFIIHAIVVLITRPQIGRMTDRKGVAFAVLPGYILSALAMILIGLSDSLIPILIAAALFAVGAGGSFPAIQTDCVNRLAPSRRTLAMGMYLIGFDIGMTLGQVMGGVISDLFSFQTAFVGAGTLMIAGCVGYYFYVRRRREIVL